MPANFDHLLLSNQELLSIKVNFVREIKNASEGKESSVSFLRHTVPQTSPLNEGEIFQVMTIGGSVFKTALVRKQNNSSIILEERRDDIPLFSTEQIFLQFIEKHLDPTVAYVSLNLAYPLKPTFHDGRLDGILLHGTKEHLLSGLVKKEIGRTLEKFIFTILNKKIYISAANDTVCLFLSDVTQLTWETTVAGIIGTGTNYALGIFPHIINLESAGFNQFNQTASGKEIDTASADPGIQVFGKELSGAYLFKHFNIINKQNNLGFPSLSSTKELSQLAEKDDSDESKLAQIVLERSAAFAACQMAGIVKFLSRGKNYIDPVSQHGMTYDFVMEGALFWDAWNYKVMLEKYLKILGANKLVEFSPIRHHSIRGGIKLLSGLS